MLGILSSQRPILGVLLSQGSTLGVLSPQEPMNMSGQLGKNFYKEEKQTKKTQVIPDSCSVAQSFCIPGA